jgi:hypothetical protein
LGTGNDYPLAEPVASKKTQKEEMGRILLLPIRADEADWNCKNQRGRKGPS